MRSFLIPILVLLALPSVDAGNPFRFVRRLVNFNGLFGSSTSASPYERVGGHPVFSVTTSFGSPYMTMEKLSDLDETVPVDLPQKEQQSLSEEQSEVRMVALYFMDPADALGLHAEMKQLENLEKSDIRLTSFSLAKALRQASTLGNGLTTGQPPDGLSGNLDNSGTLRYKIMPAKRQLFYAARCRGKERVGLSSESDVEDAALAVSGNPALEASNLMKRRAKREGKLVRTKAAVPHMEGYCGIPVFYCDSLMKQPPLLKRLLSRPEKPFFFNYEDLEDKWNDMRKRNPSMPETPDVEVFNLWDVLTSMDRESAKQKPTLLFNKGYGGGALSDVTFVPSSHSVDYKERMSKLGNGKARLKPMR